MYLLAIIPRIMSWSFFDSLPTWSFSLIVLASRPFVHISSRMFGASRFRYPFLNTYPAEQWTHTTFSLPDFLNCSSWSQTEQFAMMSIVLLDKIYLSDFASYASSLLFFFITFCFVALSSFL